MSRLNGRVERLEQGDGRYCTLGEVLDAIEGEDRGPQIPKPIDPQLEVMLAKVGSPSNAQV